MVKNVKVARKIYEDLCKEYKTSPYRRYREYAGYLDRFFYSDGIVDGMAAKDRAEFLPMSMNRYFAG